MAEILGRHHKPTIYANLQSMREEDFKRAFNTVRRLFQQPKPDTCLKNEMAAFVEEALRRKLYDLAATVNLEIQT